MGTENMFRRGLVPKGWGLVLGAVLAGISWGQRPGGEGQGAGPQPSGYLFGALVRATDAELVEEAKKVEEGLTGRLAESYSFRHFELLGEHTQPVAAEYEAWVLPSEELYMKVDSKGPVEGGLGLHLQLWRRENVVLKTDVILNPGSPIFVTGPKWGKDQLVFVIQLKEAP